MSYCKEEGKDRIIFVTEEDQNEPVQTNDVKKLETEDDRDEGEGLILENGDINWNCPCLGGMASGPCGVEFREAFSCFHFSEVDPKGSDCIDNFRTMQECMVNYPDLYPVGEDKEKAMMEDEEGATKNETSSSMKDKNAEQGTPTSLEKEEVAPEDVLPASSLGKETDAFAKETDVSDTQEENTS